MPYDDKPKMPYHGNHSGRRPDSYAGTAQRNYKDPKKRAEAMRDRQRPFAIETAGEAREEINENLLVGRNPIR